MRFIILTKKQIVTIACCALALVFAAYLTAQGIAVATGTNKRLIPIYSVETEKKQVCLTFDAAWGNEDTQELIDILAKYNIKATFFIVGDWVVKYPESVKALHEAGHSIQNHSDKHPHLPKMSRGAIAADIKACNEKIEAITGIKPTLMRPPYGDYSNSVIEVMNEMEMYTIQWDVDSLDWKDLSASEIAKRVVPRVKNGSIVLFHNAALHTPASLPTIIEQLKAEGYEFLTVLDLIHKDNYKIDHTGRQIPITESSE